MASGRRVPFPCLLTMHAASTTMSARFDGLWGTLVPDRRQRRQECQQLYSSSLIWALEGAHCVSKETCGANEKARERRGTLMVGRDGRQRPAVHPEVPWAITDFEREMGRAPGRASGREACKGVALDLTRRYTSAALASTCLQATVAWPRSRPPAGHHADQVQVHLQAAMLREYTCD